MMVETGAPHTDELLGPFETQLLKDPGNDELRQGYVEAAASVGAQLRAAEMLGRALKKAKGNGLRERVWFDVATLYLREGELKQARGAFLEVVLVDAGGPCAIAAARRLLDLEVQSGDLQVIGTALEMIAKADPEPSVRQEAATRLLAMHDSKPLKESRLAVAFQALVDSPRADEALAWLRAHHERKGDGKALSEVYRRQALREPDPAQARSLALRSIELFPCETDADTIAQWLWFVEAFGPDHRAHVELVSLLERGERWDDLCRVLEADVELVAPEERAAILARLGQTRLVVLGDGEGALSAFRRCLSLDPWNELARNAVETLLAVGNTRLGAADVLEPIYRVAKFHEGELRVLETRAELLEDPQERLAALAGAVDLAKGKLADPQRAMRLCERALAEAFAFATDAVLDWLVRLERVATVARQPDAHAAILLPLLGDGALDSPERLAMAVSAIGALLSSGAPERALSLCRLAIARDPSSPELLAHLDRLLDGNESPGERLARYDAALRGTAASGRRSSLMHAVAAIKRDALGDIPGAIELWRQILAEDPADIGAHEALIDATEVLGDFEGAAALIDSARRSLRGHQRNRMTLRKALTLVRRGAADRALDLCRTLVDEPEVPASILQSVADIARDEDDPVLYRHALDQLIASAEIDAKRSALERLGDFVLEREGDRNAAVESWKAAAQLYGDAQPEQDRARALYEHALEARPDDIHTAGRLVELYAASGDWIQLPAALRVIVRHDDLGACVLLLLRLEESAMSARAVDEFVALADELIERLERESPEQIRALGRARARALASDPARQASASQAYRALIQSFEGEDDVRDFQAFVESRLSAEERHQDRRWLYRWRAARTPHSADVLVEWAKAEEEYGAPDAAIPIYQRLAEADGSRAVALEALCRLKFHGGDMAGGLAAFTSLRDGYGDEQQRLSLNVRMARRLIDEFDLPGEAASLLAPTLAVRPAWTEAHELARRMLRDPASRDEVAARIEQAADAVDALAGLRIFEFLLTSEVAADGPASRSRWLQRVADLSQGDPPTALSLLVQGAIEQPSAVGLWDAAERIARATGQADVVARACHRVLIEQDVDPALAKLLGRRMVGFEEEGAIDPSQQVAALLRVLEAAPSVRWALDRVKPVLGSQARYGELFALYDRAIDAAADEPQLCELLHEAAFAARDLAGDPDRAIGYLESLHVLQSEDRAVEDALERLYERMGRKVDVIDLLSGRLDEATGFERRDLRRRIASLWLDSGEAERAGLVIDQMLSDRDAVVGEVLDLLERLMEDRSPAEGTHPAGKAPPAFVQRRALALLRGHYDGLGQLPDSIRIAERSFTLADDADAVVQSMRDLIRLRLRVAENGPGPFAEVIAHVESYLTGDLRLSKVTYRALLVQAIRRLKRTPAGQADAEEGAWWSIQALRALLERDDPEAALRFVYRCSRLPLARGHRRELLQTAAALCSARLRDSNRAIRIFAELFDDDAGDALAATCLEPFAGLLEATGQHAMLARVWEEQGRVRARAGDIPEERAFWQRAAELWERQAAWDAAVHAHRRGAALGADGSFEALARIHAARREWPEATKALEWLHARAPARLRGESALRLAEAYVELDERDRARACLENALHAPTDATEQVRERLLGLYRRDGVCKPLARLLSAEARRAGAREQKLALLREASDLHRWRLNEPAEAADLLEQAMALDPDDSGLRASLVDVLEALESWGRMAAALRAQIQLYGDRRSKDRALVHHRLARALVGANLPEEGLAELRVAVEMDPADPTLSYDLARLALQVGDLDLSEQTYRALLLATHRSTDELKRSDIFVDLVEIAVQRGDTGPALDWVDSALDEASEQGEDPRRFEQGLRARGRYELLARALERRVRRGATLTDRAVALGDLADLWAGSLGRPADLGARISQHVERIGRDLDRNDRPDASAWAALAKAYGGVGEDRARLAALLQSAISKLDAGADRGRLRVLLARTLLEQPPESNGATGPGPGHERAMEELSLAVADPDADAPVVLDATWRLGLALEQAGRANDALTAFESMIDGSFIDRETCRVLADRLEALGSERVADCLQRWMTVDARAAPGIAKRIVEIRDKQGDRAGSIRALEAGFSADPADTELRDRLVGIHEEQSDWGQVVRVLRCAIAAVPDDQRLVVRLIEAHQKEGSDREALRVLDVALAGRPGDAELLSLRAGVRERVADYDGALSDLESATAVNSTYVNALLELFGRVASATDASGADAHALRLAETLIRVNRPKLARRELERLLARSPNHREGLAAFASLAAAEGNWKSAADVYRKLLLIASEKGSAREELARIALATAGACDRAGVLGETRELLDGVRDLLSQSPDLVAELEQLCLAMKDWSRVARLMVSRAEREEDGDSKASLLLRAGRLLLDEAGDPARALEVIELTGAPSPDHLEALLLWTGAQVALGQARQALAALHEAAERHRGKRSPRLANVYLEMGRAHLTLDEVVEAFEALESGFNLDWRAGDIAMLLGLVALDLSDDRAAERAFSAVTTLPPRREGAGSGADAATRTVAYYHLATLALSKGDFTKARRLATKAVGGDPAHVAARALLEQLDSQDVSMAVPGR